MRIPDSGPLAAAAEVRLGYGMISVVAGATVSAHDGGAQIAHVLAVVDDKDLFAAFDVSRPRAAAAVYRSRSASSRSMRAGLIR